MSSPVYSSGAHLPPQLSSTLSLNEMRHFGEIFIRLTVESDFIGPKCLRLLAINHKAVIFSTIFDGLLISHLSMRRVGAKRIAL